MREPGSWSAMILLNVFDVAAIMQVSEKTVRRLIDNGKLPCIRIGRTIRFFRGDVFRFVEARRG